MDSDETSSKESSIYKIIDYEASALDGPPSLVPSIPEEVLNLEESIFFEEPTTEAFNSEMLNRSSTSEAQANEKEEEVHRAEDFKSPVKNSLSVGHFSSPKSSKSLREKTTTKEHEEQYENGISDDHIQTSHRNTRGKKMVKKSSPRLYIGWRCPHYLWDCYRIGNESKCFCGHLLSQHRIISDISVPCTKTACRCQMFCFIPSRPEEVGEFWLQKRSGFDPKAWRALCRCKHNHEEHLATGSHACRHRGCQCNFFQSNFLCAACDRRWEEHETFFESEEKRKQRGRTTGEKSRSAKGAVP
ncbi:protein FAM221B isoform X2 [Macrotis lagotis]|uniref:protein FAM221B isoform X2 n=1 Tax=Macrotis lagotis TaxID=92651 RepID=UPI003D68FDAC